MKTIYHGTPITPRAALESVGAGRALCISFFTPTDTEVAEAISPAIMFRQWGVLALEEGTAGRSRVGRKMGLARILRLAGCAFIPSRSVGGYTGYAGRALPAQRCAYQRLAVWAKRFAAVAYGRADRAVAEAVRQVRQGLSRLDGQGQGYRLPRISRTDAGSGSGAWEQVAGNSHDARRSGSVRLSIWQRRQHQSCTKRVAL